MGFRDRLHLLPQTEEQQRIEARTNELADGAAKKLGMNRRKFMATIGGMAATFVAMNEVVAGSLASVSWQSGISSAADTRYRLSI